MGKKHRDEQQRIAEEEERARLEAEQPPSPDEELVREDAELQRMGLARDEQAAAPDLLEEDRAGLLEDRTSDDPASLQVPPSIGTRIDPEAGRFEPLPPNASDDERRAYVVRAGLVTAEQAAELVDPQLHSLVVSIDPDAGGAGADPSRIAPPGQAVLPPFTSQQPQSLEEHVRQLNEQPGQASVIDSQLRALGREDKIAIVTERSMLSVAEAAALGPDDLDAQVRTLLEQRFLLEQERATIEERARRGDAIAPPPVGTPYGGVDVPQHYVFQNPLTIALEGQLVSYKPGDLVNDRTHDIGFLKRQGAQLLACEAPAPFTG